MTTIWKPLVYASLLGMACCLPVQAHGPWTDHYSRSQPQSVYLEPEDDTSAMWNTATSRDPMGLPRHGAWGTGSMVAEHAITGGTEGGYRSEPVIAPPQPSYVPALPERRGSDDYPMRGY